MTTPCRPRRSQPRQGPLQPRLRPQHRSTAAAPAATSPAAESASPAPEAEPLASSSQVIRLGQERVSAPLVVAPEQSDRLRNLIPGVSGTAPAGPSATPQAARSGRIILRLSGIDFDRPPGKPYQVYVNLPEGQDPDPHSIYFAGVLGFFGLSAAQHDPGHSGSQRPGGVRLFDITDLVARQTAAGVWTGDQPSVTFVSAAFRSPGARCGRTRRQMPALGRWRSCGSNKPRFS